MGDTNDKFFYNTLKQKHYSSRISTVMNENRLLLRIMGSLLIISYVSTRTSWVRLLLFMRLRRRPLLWVYV